METPSVFVRKGIQILKCYVKLTHTFFNELSCNLRLVETKAEVFSDSFKH